MKGHISDSLFLVLLIVSCTIFAIFISCNQEKVEAVPDTYEVYKVTYSNGDIDTIVIDLINSFEATDGAYIVGTDTLGKSKYFNYVRRYEFIKKYVIKDPVLPEPEFKLKNKQTN